MCSTRDSLDSKDIFFRVLCTGPAENIGTGKIFQKFTQTASLNTFWKTSFFLLIALMPKD